MLLVVKMGVVVVEETNVMLVERADQLVEVCLFPCQISFSDINSVLSLFHLRLSAFKAVLFGCEVVFSSMELLLCLCQLALFMRDCFTPRLEFVPVVPDDVALMLQQCPLSFLRGCLLYLGRLLVLGFCFCLRLCLRLGVVFWL